MWNNYFYQIQTKYSMRLSLKNPLVLRLDGRGITSNKKINLMNKYKGGFADSLEKGAKYFSKRYHCLCVFGSDEISFIVDDPNIVINDLEPKDKSNFSNEIIAMFVQYFFNYFNSIYKSDKVFWHGKCFSINKEKKISYIKYRSRIIENVLVTYFLKRKKVKNKNGKIDERVAKARKFKDYEKLKRIQKGILYYDGNKIKLNDYIDKGEINIIKKNQNKVRFNKGFNPKNQNNLKDREQQKSKESKNNKNNKNKMIVRKNDK